MNCDLDISEGSGMKEPGWWLVTVAKMDNLGLHQALEPELSIIWTQ